MPELHAVVYRDIRKALVRKFPYSVFYRIKPGGRYRARGVSWQARSERLEVERLT